MLFWLVVFGTKSLIKGLKINITDDYLLIPIQEDGSPEYKTNIFVDGKFEVVNDIRFAKDYVTYTFPLNVTNWIGKEVRFDIDVGDNHIGNYVFWKGLKQSDDYESKFDYDERYRPWYHFTPEYGWMNDPNGMFSTKDENGEITYHFHYQYNPYAAVWGNMHWGHAISKDLLHWKYLPHSLAPDELGAIFSGSSIVDEENSAGLGKNTIFSYYTSTLPRQQQSMAYSKDNGFTWIKWAGNPIVENVHLDDFRDPKVCKIWLKGANKPIYIMTLAVGQHVEFWKSDNLLEWKYASSFGEEYGAHGGVWECPDLLYFEEYDKHVLLVNINPGGPFGGSSCQYFVGKFDGTTFTCDEDKSTIRWLEYGKDAYATVTYPKDQRIQGGSTSKTEYIGMTWMSNWQYAGVLPSQNYRSAMTIPRKISLVKLSNGTYVASNLPIDAITNLRGDVITDEKFTLGRGQKDRWVFVAPENCAGVEFNIEFTVTGNGRINFMFNNFYAQHFFVRFDPSTRTVTCQRDKSGIVSDSFAKESTSAQIPIPKTTYKWRIFFDSCSVEFFDEDGLATMTNLAFPTGVYTSLYISKDNNDDVLDIKSIKINKIKKVMKQNQKDFNNTVDNIVVDGSNHANISNAINEALESLNSTSNETVITIKNTDPDKVIPIKNLSLSENQFLDFDKNTRPKIDLIDGPLNILVKKKSEIHVTMEKEKDAKLKIKNYEPCTLVLDLPQSADGKKKDVSITSSSEIYNELKIDVQPNINSVTVKSINLYSNGSISSNQPITINEIEAKPQTTGKISNVTIADNFKIDQSASLELDNVVLTKTCIIMKLNSFNESDIKRPMLTGSLGEHPSSIQFENPDDGSIPNENTKYTLFQGTFQDSCKNWGDTIKFDDSIFNAYECLSVDSQIIILEDGEKSLSVMRNSKKKSKLSGGQIAGIVIGVIAGVAVIGVAVICYIKKKNSLNSESEASGLGVKELTDEDDDQAPAL